MHDFPNIMDIAFCVDESYVSQLAVALHSIKKHLSANSSARAHIVGKLSPSSTRRLRQLGDKKMPLAFYRDLPDYSGLPISDLFKSRLSTATYYRLALPDLMHEYDRVLYLDADIMVLDDLTVLWDTPIGNSSTGVVDDFFLTEQKRWQHLSLKTPRYFNAGVMLMNLDLWRKDDVAAQVARALQENPDWEYNDQDGLNVILNERCFYLEPKWNVTTTRLNAGPPPDPRIIHFTGQEKPWHHSSLHPYRETYLSCLKQTPWKDAPLTHFLDHEDHDLLETLWQKLPEGGRIAIYGCGARGRRLALYLQSQHPQFDIRFMLDRSAGKSFENIPVYNDFPLEHIDAVVIASVPYREEIIAKIPEMMIAQDKVI
jgi:lipopolysaccharide biosynthesis glycosyltransferase